MITPILHNLSWYKACRDSPLLLAYSKISTSFVENWNTTTAVSLLKSNILTFLALHSGKSVFILCGKPARQKSQPKTSLALFSYVQTNQFVPYCLLKTSARCAELSRDVYTIRRMVSRIVSKARFFKVFKQQAPI